MKRSMMIYPFDYYRNVLSIFTIDKNVV